MVNLYGKSKNLSQTLESLEKAEKCSSPPQGIYDTYSKTRQNVRSSKGMGAAGLEPA